MTETALEIARPQDDSELGALAELAADGFGSAVTRVQELHEAIADRAFGPTGSASRGPRIAHDAVAGSVYAAVRGAGTLLGTGLARTVREAGGGPRISDHPRGRLAQGALNGVIGDRLEGVASPLAIPTAIRVGGRDVPADRDALAAAFGGATARPVVFVHGLCESDAAWSIRAAERGGTYATRVLGDVGGTAVTIRYNTGLRISENGRRLAALLEALVDAWPVPIERLALVGHSMGGLVLRSAGHSGTEAGHRWPALVDTTISLGTPHLGAPLEQAVHLASWALGAVPEGRPIAAILRTRSAGIRDLRHGSLIDAEWETLDPEALRGFERADVPLLAGARHHVVAATLTDSPDHPVGRIIGDLLVLTPSAHGLQGRRRVLAFEDESCRHVGGHGHFDLLNSPALDGLLRQWLVPEPPAPRLSGR
jgi:pimeloyl-ACP methyl ester carboxylesterase